MLRRGHETERGTRTTDASPALRGGRGGADCRTSRTMPGSRPPDRTRDLRSLGPTPARPSARAANESRPLAPAVPTDPRWPSTAAAPDLRCPGALRQAWVGSSSPRPRTRRVQLPSDLDPVDHEWSRYLLPLIEASAFFDPLDAALYDAPVSAPHIRKVALERVPSVGRSQ